MGALTLLPWMRWCSESSTIMSWHARKHVLSRCIRLHCPPALRSLLPHLSSAIFCWQPWKKRLLHIHQTTVKQGGLRKRRSSRFIRAIGLHWFHKHIGPVSCVFLLFSYHSSIVIKSLTFWAKFTRKNLPVLSFLNRMYPFAPFWTLCHANNKKTNIH